MSIKLDTFLSVSCAVALCCYGDGKNSFYELVVKSDALLTPWLIASGAFFIVGTLLLAYAYIWTPLCTGQPGKIDSDSFFALLCLAFGSSLICCSVGIWPHFSAPGVLLSAVFLAGAIGCIQYVWFVYHLGVGWLRKPKHAKKPRKPKPSDIHLE